jgi:hypothetical protein
LPKTARKTTEKFPGRPLSLPGFLCGLQPFRQALPGRFAMAPPGAFVGLGLGKMPGSMSRSESPKTALKPFVGIGINPKNKRVLGLFLSV